MTQPHLVAHPAHDALATVISISARQLDRSSGRAAEILDRRVGPGWEGLPSLAGRPGLRFENLVRQAPCGLDPADASAAAALTQALQLVRAARACLELLSEDVAVLSEALGADLGLLTFDELDSVASCVLSLGAAPDATPAWGSRATADSAALVLELIGPDLQVAAQAHEQLYGRFTDHVWEVPAELLDAGVHRWRPLSRHRLRLRLRAASRTGAVPGRLTRVTREIVEARVARARLAPIRPLLAQHLGPLDRGVLTDVEAATASLELVRDLQRALAGLYDDERMERLLLAGAFRAPELLVPARSLRTTLAAWSCDVAAAGGSGALAIGGDAVGTWSDDIERDASALAACFEHLEGLRAGATLQQAVDALVLREHAAAAFDEEVTPAGAVRGFGSS